MVPVTIRLCPDRRYHVKVYHCQGCGKMNWTKLDGSCIKRIVYLLKKWSGIDVEAPVFSGTDKEEQILDPGLETPTREGDLADVW